MIGDIVVTLIISLSATVLIGGGGLAMAGYGALKLHEMPAMFWVLLAGKPYRRQARLICQHREAANPSIYMALKQAQAAHDARYAALKEAKQAQELKRGGMFASDDPTDYYTEVY
jgi:hypothetical protein